MKRCVICNALYFSTSNHCAACQHEVQLVDGFFAYAPGMVSEGDGFKSTYFSELAHHEATNFWFLARNELIKWAIQKYNKNPRNILEIGCGTGFVLNGIANQFPNATLCGSELFTAGLSFAAQRVPHASFIQMDARNIPFQAEFDVVGAFDVLEHIHEDELVLQQMYAALEPNGLMIITVPQHQWLWSATDTYACHVRRYAAKDLHRKIQQAGFQILKSTSFVSTLLPAMVFSRLTQKNAKNSTDDATTELGLSPLLNKVFLSCLQVELALIKLGVNFPLGGSRLVVARKPQDPI